MQHGDEGRPERVVCPGLECFEVWVSWDFGNPMRQLKAIIRWNVDGVPSEKWILTEQYHMADEQRRRLAMLSVGHWVIAVINDMNRTTEERKVVADLLAQATQRNAYRADLTVLIPSEKKP